MQESRFKAIFTPRVAGLAAVSIYLYSEPSMFELSSNHSADGVPQDVGDQFGGADDLVPDLVYQCDGSGVGRRHVSGAQRESCRHRLWHRHHPRHGRSGTGEDKGYKASE